MASFLKHCGPSPGAISQSVR